MFLYDQLRRRCVQPGICASPARADVSVGLERFCARGHPAGPNVPASDATRPCALPPAIATPLAVVQGAARPSRRSLRSNRLRSHAWRLRFWQVWSGAGRVTHMPRVGCPTAQAFFGPATGVGSCAGSRAIGLQVPCIEYIRAGAGSSGGVSGRSPARKVVVLPAAVPAANVRATRFARLQYWRRTSARSVVPGSSGT